MKGDFDALLNLDGSNIPSKKQPPVLLNLRKSGSFKPVSSQDSTASFASAASNNSEVVSEAADPTHSSTATRALPNDSSESSNDGVPPAVSASPTEVAANGQAGDASSRGAADVACEASHGRPESSHTSAELMDDSRGEDGAIGTASMTAELPPPSEHSSEEPLHHASAAGSTGDAGGGARVLRTGSLQHGHPEQATGQGKDPPEAAVSLGSAAHSSGAQDLPRPAHHLHGPATEESCASEQPAASEQARGQGRLAFHDPLQSSHPSHDTHESSTAPSSAQQQPFVDGSVTVQQRTDADGAREQAGHHHGRGTSLDAWMAHAQLHSRASDSPEVPRDSDQAPKAASSRAGPDEDQRGWPSDSKHVTDDQLSPAPNVREERSDGLQVTSQHLGSENSEQSHKKQAGAPGISEQPGGNHLQAAGYDGERYGHLQRQRSASPGPTPSEELPVSTLGARCLSGALGASLPEPTDSTQALPGAHAGASAAEHAEQGPTSQPGGVTGLCQ